jgi:signal transduction histidine kinase
MDLAAITAGIWASTRFGNAFFVLYYPALVAVSVVFPSRRLSFAIVTVVSIVYAALSLGFEPRVQFDLKEEKILAVRIITMFAVVAAANLIMRIERSRRVDAVEAERRQAQENLALQKKAQEAEVAALQERSRIAREIHDGIAQFMYMLSLNLETCAELAERDDGDLRGRLKDLVPLAKQALLETRHYIYDLKPMLSGERGLVEMARNQAKEFQTVTGTSVELCVHGEPREVSATVGGGLYRILQEALANVFKHSQASGVTVTLTFDDDRVGLTVHDDGAGFGTESVVGGYGLDNMRQRAQELGGTCKILSSPGEGTSVTLTLPA